MIVLLASAHDRQAQTLTAELADLGARLLTPGDLSQAGWSWRPDQPSEGRCRIDGSIVSTRDVMMVIVRLPWVSPEELVDLDPADREYAAAELTAFLSAWLTCIPAPVLNTPTVTCLAGPHRPLSWWQALLSRSGRSLGAESPGGTVVVVDRQVEGPSELGPVSRRLAGAADVRLVQFRFAPARRGPAELVDVDLWPDITTPARLELLRAAIGRLARPHRPAARRTPGAIGVAAA